MPKFAVFGRVHGTKHIGEVEAADEQAARAAAEALPVPDVTFCPQCSQECADAEVDGFIVEPVEMEEIRRQNKRGFEAKRRELQELRTSSNLDDKSLARLYELMRYFDPN
jgi:hypothetical protein